MAFVATTLLRARHLGMENLVFKLSCFSCQVVKTNDSIHSTKYHVFWLPSNFPAKGQSTDPEKVTFAL